MAKSHYPPKCLHGAVFRWELPTLWKSKKEARLRFVEPVSLFFDTFPDYARYEVVPMFWDCWPCYFEKTCEWLRRHQVKTAIFVLVRQPIKCKNVSPGRTWNGKNKYHLVP